MTSEVIEVPNGTRLETFVEGAERANAVLHALLQNGYRTDGQRETIGQGILLHNAGDGPDLVLYPNGSLQPVGSYRQQTILPTVPDGVQPRQRSLKAYLMVLVKGLALLVVAVAFWFLSVGLWLAILENF